MSSYPSFKNTEAYSLLCNEVEKNGLPDMRALFQSDPGRFNDYHITEGEILFDYSKNGISNAIRNLLIRMARELDLQNAINAMFRGDAINATEKRAVLHTALRNFSGNPVVVDKEDVMPFIQSVLQKMRDFTTAVHAGTFSGFTGRKFTDIVNIGIGGSDLGPQMVCEALKFYTVPGITMHFVSNVDATHITETISPLDPETTLFLIASKTFTTQETMANARAARKWFLQTAGNEKFIANHFVALSTAREHVLQFGISEENIFEFRDWVGGRFSVWSAIGLSVCLGIGYDHFEKLLQGAFAADEHFRNSSLEKNIPVMMALTGFWNSEFLGCRSHAVIPYDQYMHRFPAYLQQTDMESNGKSSDRNGNSVHYHTGPVIWGEPGTNGQHAFFQLLHQGTQIIPCDFIAPANSHHPEGDQHILLLSNFFAQTEALMNGKSAMEVETELRNIRIPEQEIQKNIPFRVFAGNRPTNSFLIKKITPRNLGMLIAFYEHKIFTQGIIWNIYSFDQWGVELGKKLALQILPELKNNAEVSAHDSSTNGLINMFKHWREEN